MMRATLAVIGLTSCLLAACDLLPMPGGSSHQYFRMVPVPEGNGPLLGARDAVRHVLVFLSNVPSTTSFTPSNIGEAMGVTLGPDPNNDPGWAVYHSRDLGRGWTYWVQYSPREATMKPGFRFWFDHPDRAADATPVCALPLDQLRASLSAHDWVERSLPSEIGSTLAIEFAKADMVLTLTQRDGADVNGTACVLSLQTSDGG